MRTAYVRTIFHPVHIEISDLCVPCMQKKISGTQTVYDLMRTQIKIPLKWSQNDNLSTSIVRLLCQQSKSSYNMNAASDRFILHTMQYIMHLQ